ncbi:nitroimidazol reductase NimA-like FMN-containing flavoprotein (pyridoxamine 5'-phosphate oxidase superfamily) [Pseudonocardia eucalypti]|nr:nitroimidazol reductase NimA-like FMN-containing flavoprotein (pyridoxamine 5'-phosphate oxidase superfamily) [Pseudonocardia eucalypti]
MSKERDLAALTEGECLRLLAGSVIGRVVFVDAALPAIQPVNFLLDGQEVIFRTANGAKLAAATRESVVAFEVDEIDPDTRTGWSVVCIGRSYEVTDPARLAALADTMPRPWAPDRTAHTIAIDVQRVTGRQVSIPAGINQDMFTSPHTRSEPGQSWSRRFSTPPEPGIHRGTPGPQGG